MSAVIGLTIMFFIFLGIFIYGISPVIIKQKNDAYKIDPIPHLSSNDHTTNY